MDRTAAMVRLRSAALRSSTLDVYTVGNTVPMETDEPLETGYGTATPPGDNLLNDYQQGLAEAYAGLGEARGDRVRRDDEAALVDRSSPSPFVNQAVVRQPFDDGQWREAADRMHEYFAGHPGAGFLLFAAWPTPDLTALGFGRVGHPPLMLRQAGPLTPGVVDGLGIRHVEDAQTAADWEAALIRGFPTPELPLSGDGCVLPVESLRAPNWHFWVGYLDGVPVATSAAHIGGHHVDVEFVSCVPEGRGRGIGAAMTAEATTAAPELPAMLIASDLGQPVYRRLGYRSMLRFTLWVGHRRE